jgi:26S proteasome regulatory subunit T6
VNEKKAFAGTYLVSGTLLCWFCTYHLTTHSYYISKIEELQIKIRDKNQNFERLKAQRNELNNKVKLIREELTHLHEPGSYIGEVVKPMGKQKVLVKVNSEGKYVVDLDKDIDINKCTPNTRVALRADSYTLHKILPTKVDPLVSLMKVTQSSLIFNLLKIMLFWFVRLFVSLTL